MMSGYLKMYSTNGVLIKEQEYRGNFKMDVSNLDSGNYILVLEYEKGKFFSKKLQVLR